MASRTLVMYLFLAVLHFARGTDARIQFDELRHPVSLDERFWNRTNDRYGEDKNEKRRRVDYAMAKQGP
jgi:hypothetical protein